MSSHRTYCQLFQDSAEAPIAPDKVIAVNAKIYEQFGLAQKSNINLLTLLHHLFEDCIGGLVMVLQDHKGCPCFHLVHGLQRFLPSISGLLQPSLHQHSIFGYLGNVEDNGDATLIKLNSNMLAFTGGVRAQLQEKHKAALVAANDSDLLPCLEDMATGTEIIRAGRLMFVPFPVMHVLLENKLSSCQAFLDMPAFLESNHALTHFSPLLEFLRITSTPDNTGDPNNLHLSPGLMFFSDKKLVVFIKEKILY